MHIKKYLYKYNRLVLSFCYDFYSRNQCFDYVTLQCACVSLIQMCVESTGNGIGTGKTADTGDEVYEEPVGGET